MELVLTEHPPEAGEIEFCHFKLQEGARLRFIYDDFEDLCTEYDTINLLDSPFCSKGQSTLHPCILQRFARELLLLHPENPVDTAFCFSALGMERCMNLQAVSAYLAVKMDFPLPAVSHSSVYQGLLAVLKEEKRKSSGQPVKKTGRKPMILVD